jgi:hypothetical protein
MDMKNKMEKGYRKGIAVNKPRKLRNMYQIVTYVMKKEY